MKNVYKEYKIVLKKELKDAFRDKKSIIASLILPLLMFPVLFFLMNLSAESATSRVEAPIIAIVACDNDNNLTAVNETNELYNYINNQILPLGTSMNVNCEIKLVSDYVTALIEGDIYVAVVVPENLEDIVISQNGVANISFIYDDRSSTGASTASVVKSVFALYNDVVVMQRVETVDPNLNIIAFNSGVLSVSEAYPDLERSGTSNALLQLLIPLLITMLISIGGTTIAVDLVAGEKERNTFEPLLTTSANRVSILSAKYSVVMIFSFLSAIAEVLSVVLCGILLKDGAIFDFSSSGFTMPIDGLILVFCNLLMLAALFSGLLLILTSSASTIKEASSKAMWVTFLPMIIAYSTMYLEVTGINFATAFLPIYNVVVSIKMLLAGVMNYTYIITALVANVAYAGLSVLITLKMFSKESLIVK